MIPLLTEQSNSCVIERLVACVVALARACSGRDQHGCEVCTVGRYGAMYWSGAKVARVRIGTVQKGSQNRPNMARFSCEFKVAWWCVVVDSVALLAVVRWWRRQVQGAPNALLA